MTGHDLAHARLTLGFKWGFGRALWAAELGRALRYAGADPGQSIRHHEAGRSVLSDQAIVAVQMMLAGAMPPDGLETLRK